MTSRAADPDGIRLAVLKPKVGQLTVSLSNLFNAPLDTGRLPDDWLLATAVPIHKAEIGTRARITDQRA
ncbi:unnamed protein product [Echinostoma caproni]|uniref:Type II toxin-antitoxin system PemK/MazF family toxin n=1 Tax=Echinostoma caproni TaxID=27848 RepID=A0A183B569_9TREM|nr:unnamed protein product [Echinostoma caproni]